MIKCKLCGKEIKNKRAAHGHLITQHSAEYRESGMKQALFMDYGGSSGGSDDQEKKTTRPHGFRHLNGKEAAERKALEFYDYIDSEENLYTAEEAKAAGWI